MRSRRIVASPRLVAGIALLLLSAVGCSSVPTSSKATVVTKAPSAGAEEDVQDEQIPRQAGAPVPPEAAPDAIVDGFLGAEQDTTSEGTLLAQDYLTTATVWDPGGETVVYNSKTVVPLPSTDPTVRNVQVTYELLARISVDGEYRPDVSRIQQIFEVSRVSEGWRISSLPRGRRIANKDLGQVFRRDVPYFYSSRDYDTLIPEPTYLLNQSSKRVYSLVDRLIKGPTPLLADFLPRSLFPPGTELQSAPQPENGIAEVTFSRELESAPYAIRPQIVAQIVWTLTALDSRIDAVTIKVGDRPFLLDSNPVKPQDASSAQTQAKWSSFDPDLPYSRATSYFNIDGTLGSYRPFSAVHTGRPLGAGAGKPVVYADGSAVAVVANHELGVGPAKAGPLVPQSKFDLITQPSPGTAQDGVWVVTQQGKETPVVYSLPADAAELKRVPATELTSRVDAFEVAPDGLRVAAIIDRGGQRSLEIGFIHRPDITGKAVRVAGFRPVVSGTNPSPLAVAWLDSGKLAFIGQRGAEDPAVFTVRIDGTQVKEAPGSQQVLQTTNTRIAPQLVPIAIRHDDTRRGDGSSPDQMLLVIDDSTIYANRGLEWTKLSDRSRNQ